MLIKFDYDFRNSKYDSSTYRYIYMFITINNNSLLINEVEVDPNGPISSIVRSSNNFEIIEKNTLEHRNINNFLNENFGYNCLCIYDIGRNLFHLFSEKGINRKIIHIKHCSNKYFEHVEVYNSIEEFLDN
ncbi:MAG: hypothetical protein ACI35S_06575 [Anaeroplasma sp.]